MTAPHLLIRHARILCPNGEFLMQGGFIVDEENLESPFLRQWNYSLC